VKGETEGGGTAGEKKPYFIQESAPALEKEADRVGLLVMARRPFEKSRGGPPGRP